MTKTKSKKSAKQTKVLVASIVLAGMIVVGGSFAWFTAKDTVTNQLSASSTYDVTGTETFTPPEQWTPGQDIKKEVGAVNTGNIDAFVKVTVNNELILTNYGTPETYNASNVKKYIELNKEASDAVAQSDTANAVGAKADEVTTLQAGGTLVCEAGTTVAPTDKQDVSSSDYKPKTTGLYIFRRTIDEDVNTTTGEVTSTCSYTGYYYVVSSNDTGGQGTYYAIDDTTITIPNGTTTTYDAKLKTTVTKEVKPTLTYVPATTGTPATDAYIKAVYDPNPDSNDGDEIIINIKLDQTNLARWTPNAVAATTDKDSYVEFYFNEILKAGKETGNLITAVELDSSVTEDAYLSFDYNLTIDFDSAQVVTSDDSKDKIYNAVNAQDWNYNVTATADQSATSGDTIPDNQKTAYKTVTWAAKSSSST